MSSPAAASCRAWIDGAARGNPGAAGFGVRLERDEEVEELAGYLGHTTNNVAEYAGLIAALSLARRREARRLHLFSDSQLLVRQVNGEYKVKAPHLKPLFLRALALKQGFESVRIEHVRREANKDADRLANVAIDRRVAPPAWLELDLPAA